MSPGIPKFAHPHQLVSQVDHFSYPDRPWQCKPCLNDAFWTQTRKSMLLVSASAIEYIYQKDHGQLWSRSLAMPKLDSFLSTFVKDGSSSAHPRSTATHVMMGFIRPDISFVYRLVCNKSSPARFWSMTTQTESGVGYICAIVSTVPDFRARMIQGWYKICRVLHTYVVPVATLNPLGVYTGVYGPSCIMI